MNSQYTTSNDMTSNLHLLSKVIEDNEGEKALVHRALTCPKRISLPSSPRLHTKMELSSDESPTSCSNTKLDRVAKSWKKRAIIAMEKETPSSPSKVIHHNSDINDTIDPVETTRSTPTMKNDDDKDIIDQPEHSESITSATTSMMSPLPLNFQPGPYDVLCGRGRACKDAPGNKAYRIMIMNQLHIYAEAPTKLAKGLIISNIMEQIQQQCYVYHGNQKIGGFIKYQNGRWYDVGEFLAREKTSQCFRDALAAQYSSSAQSKYLRRRASREISNADSTTSNEQVQDDNGINADLHHHLNQNEDANRSSRTSPPHRLVSATENIGLTNQSKKKGRYITEETAADALQQLASFNRATTLLKAQPSSCSPSPDQSPQSSNPLMTTTSGARGGSAFTSVDYSSKFSAPSAIAVPRFEPPRSTTAAMNTQLDIHHHSDATPTNNLDLYNRPTQSICVCALQLALRSPEESPWDALVRAQRQMETIAACDSVDMFVLPELAPIGYSEDTFSKYLPINATNQAMYQEFDRFFQVTARKLHSYICYGTIGWSYENRNVAMISLGIPKLFIRQIVVDRLGTQIACYDKTYLCNYGDCAESRYFQPGPASVPTSFPVYTRDRMNMYRFGLLICSDMRYPNLSRALTAEAEHRVDCILQPAAFVRDCSFRTWSSFRETRAVENSIFWIGVNYAGSNYGETSIVPPFVDKDHEPISLDCDEGYVIGRVARNTLDHARTQYPFYRTLLLEESINSRK